MFADFLKEADFDEVFTTRFINAVPDVDSLNTLQRFARERWPEQYSKDWRKSTAHFPYGSEAMRALWGKYLAWKENQDA